LSRVLRLSKSSYSHNWINKAPKYIKLVCDPEIRLQITTGMLNLLYFGKTTILTKFQTLQRKIAYTKFFELRKIDINDVSIAVKTN